MIERAGDILSADCKIIIQVTEERIVGKRHLGRPRKIWKDVIGKDLSTIQENVQIEDAINRVRWNEIVVTAMELHGPLSC